MTLRVSHRAMTRPANSRRMHTARPVGRPSSTHSDLPTPVVDPPPPFLPCCQPPTPRSLPSLPLRPADDLDLRGVQGEKWTRWKCIAPAAYPRTFLGSLGRLSRESTPHGAVPAQETKAEREERCMGELKRQLSRRHDAGDHASSAQTPVNDPHQQEGLYLAAEGWKREGATNDGYTLVCAHANGMHKESWYPVIKRLIANPLNPRAQFGLVESHSRTSSSRSPRAIDEIWLLDDYHHAASIDLNKGRIGSLHNWEDGGRDIINFVQHLLPPMDQPWSENGTILPWRKAGTRRVVGLGHSFGGNAIVQAAHARPDLFEALFLVEPMCVPINSPRSTIDDPLPTYILGFQAFKRRSSWDNLDQAISAFAKSPILGRWHPEIVDVWNLHGFVPNGEGVQLATPSWAESAVFAEPSSRAVGWDKLAELQMPVGSIIGGDSRALGSEEEARELVLRPRDSRCEIIDGAAHLIVQEDPAAVADCVARFLGQLQGQRGQQHINAKL